MESKEEMLKKLGLKTMFNISDEEMPELVEEYAYPYEIETSFLREDNPVDVISLEDVLANAKSVQENQIKVPKVVG